jgi:hypothetical protein
MGGGSSKTKNNRTNNQMQSSYGPHGQDDEDYDDEINDQLVQGYYRSFHF